MSCWIRLLLIRTSAIAFFKIALLILSAILHCGYDMLMTVVIRLHGKSTCKASLAQNVTQNAQHNQNATSAHKNNNGLLYTEVQICGMTKHMHPPTKLVLQEEVAATNGCME